jgi:uncharacterized protein
VNSVSMQPFSDARANPPVRGFLHTPDPTNGDGMVLTHGAGANCNAPLLIALADEFAGRGFTVLRCDLPFRQKRPNGPPGPGNATEDRAGLQNAVEALRSKITGRVFLGGHSYGGRQATMLSASNPGVAEGLLLLSYPLHPPRKPEQLRTQHFPQLQTPALFVQGTRDPFGTIEEVESALNLIPGKHELFQIEDAGHDLGFKGKSAATLLPGRILEAFTTFAG